MAAAARLAISQSPLLLSAKEEVADLWSREEGDQPAPEDPPEPPTVTRPVTETPVETPLPSTDNGVPARTLVPSGPSGYTVAGKVYISNATGYGLSLQELTEKPAAVLGTGSGEPQILIVHTHGSESYTPPEGTDIAYTGDHRTTDTTLYWFPSPSCTASRWTSSTKRMEGYSLRYRSTASRERS